MGRMKETAEQIQEIEPARQMPQETVQSKIIRNWPRIADVASSYISKERLLAIALSTVNRNPKLQECSLPSLLSCMMRCSALGLEPSDVDGLGRAYILPFNSKKNGMEATFILGYKGLIELARRSGEIKDISARAVYEGDEFEYQYGLDEFLNHRPGMGEKKPDKLQYVYCVVHFKDGGHYFNVMNKDEVEAIRKRSKTPNFGPWVSDYEAMAKKTVIKSAAPYLPLNTTAMTAIASDDTTGGLELEIKRPLEVEVVKEIKQPKDEPETELLMPNKAACKNCGNVIEETPFDVQLTDLNELGCCNKPDYEFVGE